MFLGELLNNEKISFLSIAKELIESDSKVDKAEKELLEKYKIEMGLEQSYSENSSQNFNEALEKLSSISEDKKRKIYMEIYALAFCDGDYDEEEKKIVENIKISFGISDEIQAKLEAKIDELNELYRKIYETVNI